MRFEEFAARPFAREDLNRLTAAEEDVLHTRRRHGVVKSCDLLNMSPSTLYRKEKSIIKKLSL